jgi:hypothetical protein
MITAFPVGRLNVEQLADHLGQPSRKMRFGRMQIISRLRRESDLQPACNPTRDAKNQCGEQALAFVKTTIVH